MIQPHPDTEYMTDDHGRLVPIRLVKPADLARDALVSELHAAAAIASAQLATLKRCALDDIAAFLDLSAEQYGAKLGGRKGNVTLYSYDGLLKIERQFQERLAFDERLQGAKALIDECLTKWSSGSDERIRTLVLDAFQVDKAGRVSTERILGLRRLKIDDETWGRAMTAISDSIRIDSSKLYVRFYKRAALEAPWEVVSLDLASVEAVQ